MQRIRSAAIASFGVLALTTALFTSPVGATDRDGDADRDLSTSYTEDDDTNDGGTANNVADDDDNAHPSGNDRSVEGGGSGNQGRSESEPDDDGHGPERDYEGTDKPNGPGGVDQADQDGNNGCGNDDDYEDDNEGWCGNKPAKPVSENAAGTASRCDRDADMHADDRASGNVADSCDHGTADTVETAGSVDTDGDACADAAGMTDDDEGCDEVLTTQALTSEGETIVIGVIETFGGGATISVTPSDDATVLAASASRPMLARVSSGALAFTGDHILVLTIAALAALVLGTVLVRSTRRTPVEA